MKQIYEKIWNLALPYQDKRDDDEHAETVLHFALELLKHEKGDESVIIPAAILHDIGWSPLPKKERMFIFGKVSHRDKIKMQKKHEEIGTKMAREILEKVNYDSKLINEILEIISQHDTRQGFISKNEGIMRDADKLWRFSKTGFCTDLKRRDYSPSEWREFLAKQIDSPNYFYSETGKKIARRELEKRKEEFK